MFLRKLVSDVVNEQASVRKNFFHSIYVCSKQHPILFCCDATVDVQLLQINTSKYTITCGAVCVMPLPLFPSVRAIIRATAKSMRPPDPVYKSYHKFPHCALSGTVNPPAHFHSSVLVVHSLYPPLKNESYRSLTICGEATVALKELGGPVLLIAVHHAPDKIHEKVLAQCASVRSAVVKLCPLPVSNQPLTQNGATIG